MENPEYLAGIPFLILGGIGLFIAFSLFALPEEQPAQSVALPRHAEHPEPPQYVVIGLALALITIFEVALYYVDMSHKALVTILIFMSLAKFMLVVGFFMHLRFDNKIFSVLFFGGLVLAIGVFTVAIATLKAGLV
jgi:cytochrome c oxidase subunit 4